MEDNGKFVPSMKKHSLKLQILSVLTKIDAHLGTTYVEQAGHNRTLPELALIIERIAARYNVRAIVIDEIINLPEGSGFTKSQMDAILSIINRL